MNDKKLPCLKAPTQFKTQSFRINNQLICLKFEMISLNIA